MKSILLVGGGGHCRACIDVIEVVGGIQIVGIVQPRDAGSLPVLGYPVLGGDEDLPSLLPGVSSALVAIGQIKSPSVRINLFELLKRFGVEMPPIISPKAYCSRHASVGQGSIVMHGAVVNALAQIGENCIINSQALLEHDAVVGANCHVATGARVNGGVRVGAASFVGSGAILREGICVGKGVVIGAGRLVLSDVPDGAILKGGE
jgi:sugar O-acyltransferase (sialic acid O-acetyltransferase NeuD family)